MKSLVLTISIFVMIVFPAVSIGQTECGQPFPSLFDSIDPYDTALGNDVYKRFSEQVMASGAKAGGLIMIYGGKESFLDELTNIESKTEIIFREFEPIPRPEIEDYGSNRHLRFRINSGGYKAVAIVKLWVVWSDCTQTPDDESEYGFDDVNFRDAPLSETTYLNNDDLEKRVTTRIEPKCPAAARAVNVCRYSATVGVKVIADTEGAVLYAKAISGHPLLKLAAARAVEQWKFKRLADSVDKRYLRGILMVKFEDDNTIVVEH